MELLTGGVCQLSFICNMSEMILARCVLLPGHETDRQTAISCTLYDRCDVHELQDPRQLKVHHQLKRFNIQTSSSNISRSSSTQALPTAKTYQV